MIPITVNLFHYNSFAAVAIVIPDDITLLVLMAPCDDTAELRFRIPSIPVVAAVLNMSRAVTAAPVWP